MSDMDAIRQLLAEYCFATDCGDTERWVSLFTEDVLWEGGAFGRFTSKDEGRAYHRAAGDATRNYRHVTTNLLIRVAGNAAMVQSYVQVYDQSGAAPALMFSGVYDDELVKQGDDWRFRVRRLLAGPAAIAARAETEMA